MTDRNNTALLQGLFYRYAHMTPSHLRTLDTLEGPDYMNGYLSDEGSSRNPTRDLDIQSGAEPLNLEASECEYEDLICHAI